ncbi:MAG: hypothetical protein JRF63_08950, partial [Deltaproteobacteria bacterium]|nr:hypothetical protein [Deltaproteobacteria bacterium]
MPNGNTARDEDSVVVALQGLMGIEDERQREEHEERLHAEAEDRQRREEAERTRFEQEERQRREDEQHRLAEERRLDEEAEQRRREDREHEIRIKLDVESRARLSEQERMLEFQLEMKRISGKPRGIPAWTIGLAAVVFLVLLGVGIAFHLSETSSYQQRIVDLQANMGQIENSSAAERGAAHTKLGLVTERATSAERLVNELRGKMAGLRDKVEQLETIRPHKRPR